MMENEALQVIQKMNVKINGTEDEVKKFHEAMEVAKRALKKEIEVHPLGALNDVKKGTLYKCSNSDTRLAKKSTGRGHLENKQYSIIKYYA